MSRPSVAAACGRHLGDRRRHLGLADFRKPPQPSSGGGVADSSTMGDSAPNAV
jgi:hypothetical protein